MNKKGANLPIIILSILLIVAVIVTVFIFYNKSPETKSTTTNTDSQKTQGTIQQSSIVDCGGATVNFVESSIQGESSSVESSIQGESNFDCFIDATKSCAKSKFRYTLDLNWLGAEQTSTYYYEIKGMQSGSCIFYIKLENADLSYSDITVQEFLDRGMSQEEINQLEQETRNLLKSEIGKNGTCRYADNQQLTKLLNYWKQRNFSTESTEGFDNLNCSGRYFEIEETSP